VRLIRIHIDEFRSIQDQPIPAEGLVVLFGANSTGKSSALEAVGYLVAQAGALRSDPGDPNDGSVSGNVWFDLPAARDNYHYDA
jgi:predicted ATP-dependent endonuclease of OLD family